MKSPYKLISGTEGTLSSLYQEITILLFDQMWPKAANLGSYSMFVA